MHNKHKELGYLRRPQRRQADVPTHSCICFTLTAFTRPHCAATAMTVQKAETVRAHASFGSACVAGCCLDGNTLVGNLGNIYRHNFVSRSTPIDAPGAT